MKRFIISATVLIFAALSKQLIIAQNKSNNDDIRIKNLETLAAKLPRVTGFVNLRYQHSTETSSYLSGRNGFDIRHAIVDLKGNATTTLGYRLVVNFATSARVLDAYAEWQLLKNLSIKGGQFRTPFSLENPISALCLETTDYSYATVALIRENAGFNNSGRDIGIQLTGGVANRGDYNLIDYKVGLLNGNVINSADNNTTKDIAVSLSVNPSKPLSINGSLYKGEVGPQATKVNRQRISAGAKYENQKVSVRSEYLFGKTGLTESESFYALAAYFVTPKLQPVLKYDRYESDIHAATSKLKNRYTGGLNYLITKTSRLQLNYSRIDNHNKDIKDFDHISTQLIVTF